MASVNSFTDDYEKENKLSGGQVYTPTRTRVILRNCFFVSLKWKFKISKDKKAINEENIDKYYVVQMSFLTIKTPTSHFECYTLNLFLKLHAPMASQILQTGVDTLDKQGLSYLLSLILVQMLFSNNVSQVKLKRKTIVNEQCVNCWHRTTASSWLHLDLIKMQQVSRSSSPVLDYLATQNCLEIWKGNNKT